MGEQRKNERMTVNHEFESIDSFLTEYVSNISHGGVFIRSKSPLPVGTKVQLRFTIIVDDLESIEGEGEVVRVQDGPNPGMGVSFTSLTEPSRTVIERLLKVANQDTRLIAILEE